LAGRDQLSQSGEQAVTIDEIRAALRTLTDALDTMRPECTDPVVPESEPVSARSRKHPCYFEDDGLVTNLETHGTTVHWDLLTDIAKQWHVDMIRDFHEARLALSETSVAVQRRVNILLGVQGRMPLEYAADQIHHAIRRANDEFAAKASPAP
jgi:hypothetical protein